jgi:hypothetical protein
VFRVRVKIERERETSRRERSGSVGPTWPSQAEPVKPDLVV